MPELPLYGWICIATIFGLVIGSFLNVVILRLPRRLEAEWRRDARDILQLDGEEEALPPGIVREPSHCPQCKHPLGIGDNIPLFGWLFLGGKCRYCRAPISAQYPLVELLSAIVSGLVVWKFGPTPAAVFALLLSWVLIALSGIDFRTQLLPDPLTLPLLWLGLTLSLWHVFTAPESAIVGAALGYLSLWSVYWLFKLVTGKEGMGYGDFKLLGALGAWMGPTALLPIILLSSLSGALIGGALMLSGKYRRETPMPFGPFIAIAGEVWLMCGDVVQRQSWAPFVLHH